MNHNKAKVIINSLGIGLSFCCIWFFTKLHLYKCNLCFGILIAHGVFDVKIIITSLKIYFLYFYFDRGNFKKIAITKMQSTYIASTQVVTHFHSTTKFVTHVARFCFLTKSSNDVFIITQN